MSISVSDVANNIYFEIENKIKLTNEKKERNAKIQSFVDKIVDREHKECLKRFIESGNLENIEDVKNDIIKSVDAKIKKQKRETIFFY